MILSARLYSAEELHEMGIVNILAEPGNGEDAVRDYVHRRGKRHNAEYGVFQVRRRVQPLGYDELRDVTSIWVETAFNLDEADLRKMERLIAAQNRMRSGVSTMDAVELTS
jgi:DSF synthase